MLLNIFSQFGTSLRARQLHHQNFISRVLTVPPAMQASKEWLSLLGSGESFAVIPLWFLLYLPKIVNIHVSVSDWAKVSGEAGKSCVIGPVHMEVGDLRQVRSPALVG